MRDGTRWEMFFKEDRRTIDAPPSDFAEHASVLFKRYKVRTVLDLGCGAGRDTMALAGKSIAVIGADLAWSGLQIARSKSCSKQVRGLVQSDSRNLPFRDASFDGVYCFGLLHEFTGPDAAKSVARTMSEAIRALRPGGFLALAVMAGRPRAGLPHVRLFSESMLGGAVRSWHELEKRCGKDTGCTGRKDYLVWKCLYRKKR